MKLPNSLRWKPTFHCVTLRRLEVERGRVQRQRRVRIAAGAGADRSCSRPHCTDEFRTPGRVGDHVEHHVALRPVVEDAPAAADDRLALAGQVVDHADARRDPERVAVLQLVGDALAGLERAVEAVRARRQAADEALLDGVGQRRRHALRDERRVHAAAVGADARRRRRCRPACRAAPRCCGRTRRAGSSRPAASRPTAASGSRSARRSRASACCRPSSCPARRTRCSCSATREWRTSRPACRC